MSFFKRKNGSDKPKAPKQVSVKEATHDFIKASKEFEKTRYLEMEKSRILAWKVAFGACVVAVVNAIAIVGLTPLKTVQPYVIRYDNNTGATDIVGMFNGVIDEKQQEISAKYFSAMYVNLLESYDWYTLQSQIDKVMLFSDSNIQQRINTKYSKPDAPHKIYENSKRIEIKINNVSVIDEKGLIQVRFTKTLVPVDGGNWSEQEQKMSPKPVVSKHIATIGYQFVNVPTVDDVRLVNPFGYQVVSYRVDEEFGGN
ncbi:VirB8-like protein [Moraxella macacae 0408225]|uniref:VirB8-like protein n=1 Tax=Moraxella macacae 0408225 TaxID=1230338 RepID=L2F855_9GAMM|nr:type IV secretion system protein [Moraxella macacae]ELA09254.1 VirB8-like protein [Moraxella macacae 0408225]